ncbi:MAG: oligosaccharide flippase family protein [Candidatus Aenigmarchaeota archaeon]|nr:oligosaccharide flippase family protein [Candidatus Aenigmarchaeota archaeon]
MSLQGKLFRLASYSVVDIAALKILSGVIFIILARLLPRADIGIIGLVAGYLTLFRFLSITPESILFRDFPKIKNQLNEYLSAFIVFWAIRTALILALGGVFAYIMSFYYGGTVLPLYLFGAVVVLCLGYFQSIVKETHYVNFMQKAVTKINVVLMIIQLSLVSLLFFEPNILLYLGILLFVNISSVFVWYFILKKNFNFSFIITKDTFNKIKHSIMDFSLWQNMSGSITYLIYNIDTLILGFFVSLEVIGNYTIALTIANFFFIVPQIIQKSFTVGFSNIENKLIINKALSVFLRYALFFSVLQLVLFVFFGNILVSIFTATHVEIIFWYSLIIIAGISIFNVFRPLNSLIAVKTSFRKAFFLVYLPSGIASIIVYITFTSMFGAIGTAWGNIVAYSFFTLFLLVYVKKNLDLSLHIHTITSEEKDVLRKLFGRKTNDHPAEKD